MYNFDKLDEMNEIERLKYMNYLLKSQLSSEVDDLANISNATGIIKTCIDNLNWVGFYILRDDELVLGPFQGKAACVRLKIGKGVCGTAFFKNEVIVVPNVHDFPGHVACDENSQSEIVIPIRYNDKIVAVLDVDSPVLDRFDQCDKDELTSVAKILESSCKW